MGIVNTILITLIVIVALELLAIAVIAVLVLLRRARPRPLGSCAEIMGDNQDCAVHGAPVPPADQRADPAAPTHFERELEERMKTWGIDPHSRSRHTTAAAIRHIRRRERLI